MTPPDDDQATRGSGREEPTPGPWTLAYLSEHGGFEVGVGYLEGTRLSWEGFVIAGRADIHHLAGEMRANARLIAAAPDLLAACKLALGAFERNDAIDWSDLERAIARAEGHPTAEGQHGET